MTPQDIIAVIKKQRVDLQIEKNTQQQIHEALLKAGYQLNREFYLDKHNKPDFFHEHTGIAIEVKLKGQIMAIFRQCRRYCDFEKVKVLILASNKRMGFPQQINGKPCYFIHLGKAWL